MRKYAGFDTPTEAAEFRKMLILNGDADDFEPVTLLEIAEAARLPHEKPYLVSWTEWSED